MSNNHSYDCIFECLGCNRKFCDIKDENGFEHKKELKNYFKFNGGYYCDLDCFKGTR